MGLGVFQASPSAALDGPQALDGGWALDGSGATVAYMTPVALLGAGMAASQVNAPTLRPATINGSSMSGAVSSAASMTGAP